MTTENSNLDLSMFSYHDKIDKQYWIDMLEEFEKQVNFQMRQIDKLTNILGYMLCELTNNEWHLLSINLDLKTGLYKIRGTIPNGLKGISSILKSNFIFCTNGEIQQYINTISKEQLIKMAKDQYFELTRITIIDDWDRKSKK